MQRAARLCLGVVVGMAMAGACGGSDDPAAPADDGTIFGAYVLTGVNGSKPPGQIVLTASDRVMLDTATIRLTAGGTYSDIRRTTTIDVNGQHQTTLTTTGTFTTSGNTVTFAFTNDFGAPVTANATLNGKVMSKTEGSISLTFEKK